MKQITTLLLLTVFLNSTFATQKKDVDDETQLNTLFNKNRKNGGYGALSLNYSEIDNKDAFIMGARGAWIIDQSFAIGIGGCGFINDVDTDRVFDQDEFEYDIAGGYGGLILEPIIAPRLPVHLSFPILLGVGGVAYVEDFDHRDTWTHNDGESDLFLILEPAIELEFNMTRHMRLAASFSYRFTSDIELKDTRPDALESFAVGLVFKFGKF